MRPNLPTIAAAAALAAASAAAPAQAQVERVARFHATVEALQTTKWTSTSTELIDCNGSHESSGSGTEVLRLRSRGREKVVVQQLGDQITIGYGTWDPYDLVLLPGLQADTRLTRQGRIVHTTSGGWCSGPTSTPAHEDPDCGRRRDVATASLRWEDARHVTFSVFEALYRPAFLRCPAITAAPVAPAAWAPVRGRLSPRLLFGGRDRIVVEDGEVHRAREAFSDATSTTSFRLVLTRAKSRVRGR